MASTTIYHYVGTLNQFEIDAVTEGTVLNTNLLAGYVPRSHALLWKDINFEATFLWVFYIGGALG